MKAQPPDHRQLERAKSRCPRLWGKMECSSFLVLLVLRGCQAGPRGLNTYAVRRLRGGSLKFLWTVLLAYGWSAGLREDDAGSPHPHDSSADDAGGSP